MPSDNIAYPTMLCKNRYYSYKKTKTADDLFHIRRFLFVARLYL